MVDEENQFEISSEFPHSQNSYQMYQLVLLGSPYYVDELKEKLHNYKLSFLNSLSEVQDDYPVLCLYYGKSHFDKDYKGENLDKFIEELQVLPIVSDLNYFNQFIPDQLSEINGLKVKDENDLFQLVNFILSFFGLINVNRKVFISYKRTDTQTLAIQLFHALNFAGFHPFLDTSSIEKGKLFQKYLRHELSDSEMMLFLNSPNVEESDFVKEELEVASQLGVSIVNLKFEDCAIKQEAEISNVISMGLCKGKDFHYPEQIIGKIVKEVERFRSQAFEQKRRFLIQEINKRVSKYTIVREQEYVLVNQNAIFPWARIPISQDVESIEEKHLEAVKQKKIVYNGMYCRPDIQKHLNWLNNKCKEVQSVDVKFL